MFFRFGGSLLLVVLISLAGVALEKHSLDYRRQLSRQQYRMGVLREEYAQLRLRAEQLGAPQHLLDVLKRENLKVKQPEETTESVRREMPLLEWRYQVPE